MRRGYKWNGTVGEILDEVVFVDPVTGYVEEPMTPNRIPEGALEARGASPSDIEPASAAVQCGVPRVRWADVVRVTVAQAQEYEDQHGLAGLLTGNTKTAKPRIATGRTGAIVGMNLSPHYYPNLLNVIPEDEKKGTLGFIPTSTFQSFAGDTVQAALDVVNGPGAKVHLTKQAMLNFCAGSSRACRSTCLVSTGQHAAGQSHGYAKLRTTYAFLLDPVRFLAVLRRQLRKFACTCDADGKDAVVRLNLLSDIPWYEVCPEMIESLAGSVYWYDYTKIPFWRSENYNRLFRGKGKERRNLLDLTFSFSGSNAPQCQEALANGYRVAAVFASSNPERKGIDGWQRTSFTEIRESGLVDQWDRISLFGGSWLLVDGDASDYRIDDPGYGPGTTPCVVALNFKASGTLVSEGKTDEQIIKKARKEAAKEGWSEEQLASTIQDRLEAAHSWDEAKARMSAPVGSSRRVSERQSRFEWSKEKFGIKVPHTARAQEYAEAMGKQYWVKSKDEPGVLPPDVDPYDLPMDQIIEVSRAYDKGHRRGKEAAVQAARDMVQQLGIGRPSQHVYADIGSVVDLDAVGAGTNRMPSGLPPLAMRPIGGTDLLIGPTVPTTAND